MEGFEEKIKCIIPSYSYSGISDGIEVCHEGRAADWAKQGAADWGKQGAAAMTKTIYNYLSLVYNQCWKYLQGANEEEGKVPCSCCA